MSYVYEAWSAEVWSCVCVVWGSGVSRKSFQAPRGEWHAPTRGRLLALLVVACPVGLWSWSYVATHDLTDPSVWPPPVRRGAVSPLAPLWAILPLAGGVLLGVVLSLTLWRLAGPVGFERVVGRHLRNLVWRVRYLVVWRRAMQLSGLGKSDA